MSRGRRNTTGRPLARRAAKYTVLNVTEPAELMDFIMKKMDGISRNKVKSLLTNRVVLVDNVITTQYNFALKPGMKVQISKAKNNHEFKHRSTCPPFGTNPSCSPSPAPATLMTILRSSFSLLPRRPVTGSLRRTSVLSTPWSAFRPSPFPSCSSLKTASWISSIPGSTLWGWPCTVTAKRW